MSQVLRHFNFLPSCHKIFEAVSCTVLDVTMGLLKVTFHLLFSVSVINEENFQFLVEYEIGLFTCLRGNETELFSLNIQAFFKGQPQLLTPSSFTFFKHYTLREAQILRESIR